RLIANHTDRHFEPFSAVTEGVARVREIIKLAEERLKYEGRGTILFCDEIHRFNRAQQDAFLPWVENGIITLIGATTENPSFELTAPLLSRCRVFVFEPLTDVQIRAVIERAGEKTGDGKRETGNVLANDAIEALVSYAQGDARRALNGLEAVVYRATAPKSNRVYVAFDRAMEAARQHPAEAVPLHIRNAPTKLMEDLGYGAGYQYAHASRDAYVPQEYLPEPLRGATWYEPGEFGYEKDIRKRMEWWAELKKKATP